MARSPAILLATALASLVGKPTQGAILGSFLLAFGHPLPLAPLIVGSMVVALATAVPLTLANIGTYEIAFAIIFAGMELP